MRSRVVASRVGEIHYVCAIQVCQENITATTVAGFDEGNRLRARAWDGSRSWSRRRRDVNGGGCVVAVHRYRCELTLHVIHAIDLPLPKSAGTDSRGRVQIHTCKLGVGAREWRGPISRAVLVIWSDGDVHPCGWIRRVDR